ncbi:MAG: phosphatase PAP2 family protein, partial [Phycisphaerales bacterium]
GTYAQTLSDGTTRVLSPWGGHYVLEAMPSRHAAFAALCAVFLMVHYPRLRWLAVGLAGVVCAARVLTGAHWPSDVAAGAAIGGAIGLLVMVPFRGKD